MRKLVEGRQKGKQGKEERKEEVGKIKKESMDRKRTGRRQWGRETRREEERKVKARERTRRNERKDLCVKAGRCE